MHKRLDLALRFDLAVRRLEYLRKKLAALYLEQERKRRALEQRVRTMERIVASYEQKLKSS